jgi:PAS domain S-box-containing protein
LRLGACDYLIKPFPHVKLVVEKVRWAIERRKLLGNRLDLVNQLLRTNEELRQAVDSRRQSDERFRTLFNAVSDLVLVNTVNHNDVIDRFLEVNDAACQTLGYSREELLGMTAQQVLAPRESVAIPGMMSLLLARHKVLFETEVITKDGRGIAVEVHSTLINLGGQLVVLSVARNTTEHVLAEVKRDS